MYICFVIKQVLHKVFSLGLALIVLCSTLSFTVEKHYCGPFLVDIAVFKHAKKCDMDTSVTDVGKDMEGQTMSCCHDDVELLKTQDELNTNAYDTLSFDVFFVIAYGTTFLTTPSALTAHHSSFYEHPPPLVIKQRFKRYETYLI